jgi:hypothetical protein
MGENDSSVVRKRGRKGFLFVEIFGNDGWRAIKIL